MRWVRLPYAVLILWSFDMFYWLTGGNLININNIVDFVINNDEIEMFLSGGTSYNLTKEEFDTILHFLSISKMIVNTRPTG